MGTENATSKGFFAVGNKTFRKACELGINEACTFLVLARGSGGDNVTTKWSKQAAQNRLGVRWSKADEALKKLIRARVVTSVKGGSRPTYKLAKQGDLIWLPNTIVDGAAAERTPLVKLRESQDPMLLRLFVELYSAQNLREDGGISPDTVKKHFSRERVGQRGPYVVWSFSEEHYSVSWNTITLPHYRDPEDLTEEEIKQGKNAGVDFFRRFGTLLDLGLVQWTPYLFEGPEGEPIHPVSYHSDIPEERRLAESCYSAALRCLADHQTDYGYYAAPVPKHIDQVTMLAVARLRYRPHTSMTAAWWHETLTRCTEYADRYDAIAPITFAQEGERGIA